MVGVSRMAACTARKCCFCRASWWPRVTGSADSLQSFEVAWSLSLVNCYLYLASSNYSRCLHNCRTHYWTSEGDADDILESLSLMRHNLVLVSDKRPSIRGSQICTRIVYREPSSLSTCRSNICEIRSGWKRKRKSFIIFHSNWSLNFHPSHLNARLNLS